MFKPKKKNLTQFATVGDLQELAEGIAEIVVTKDEFKAYTDKAFKTFATKEDLKDAIKDLATKKELTQFRSEILTSVDAVLHEVKAMREEQSAHAGNHKDLVEDIQDHSQRIKKLESHASI